MAAASSALRTRLVVLGGSGFVGSHVCAEAVARGLSVLSLSRGGRPAPPLGAQPWAEAVQWHRADAFAPDGYREALADADALVVALGSPPVPWEKYDVQRRLNGETNVLAARTAKDVGVPMLVLVGAAMPRLLVPRGYRDGKDDAEAAALVFADGWHGAAVLKPGAVSGTRQLPGGSSVPLGSLLGPVSQAMRALGLRAHAPVDVRVLAAAAVDAATQPRFRKAFTVVENAELWGHAPVAAEGR